MIKSVFYFAALYCISSSFAIFSMHPTADDRLDFADVLHSLAHNHLTHAIEAVITLSRDNCDLQDETNYTSCLNSANVVAHVLFGDQTANLFLTLLLERSVLSATYVYDKTRRFNYSLEAFSDGFVYGRISKLGVQKFLALNSVEKEQLIDCLTEEYFDQFAIVTERNLNAIKDRSIKNNSTSEEILSAMLTYFSHHDFKFNAPALNIFRETILINQQQLSHQQAFAYVILILNSDRVEHASVLTQFGDEQQSFFRLYQSWIDMSTLAYGTNLAKIIWNQKRVEEFIADLTDVLCAEDIATPKNYLKCFGYDVKASPLIHFENKNLSGLCFRFLAAPFDPKSCSDNVDELLKCHASHVKN